MLKAQIKTLKILLIFSDARCLSQTNTSRTFFQYQKQLVTFYMGRQFFYPKHNKPSPVGRVETT